MRWLLLFTSLLCFGSGVHAALTLISHGKSAYRIVIPTAAIPAEKFAAEELQRYLQRMSGISLPIVTDVEKAISREILVGDTTRLKVDTQALGTDGYVLRTTGKKLVLAGGKPRGTLYAVYGLLEEHLGVRWYAPDVEQVPNLPTIAVPKLYETQAPAFDYREVYWGEMTRNGDFAARMRQNGCTFPLDDRHGGKAAVYFPFVHSMDALIPPSLYTTHPEYFPLINGKRVNGYVQRCLTNPDVLKLAIAQVRQWIKEHPDATIISVSQNDAYSWCQCPQCAALDNAEGSHMATMLAFVNAIAADIEQDYPHVLIDTLAYQYTRKPPRTLRPRKNVIIRLCSIECCFAHPFDLCSLATNKAFVADMDAWQPVAPHLSVWDYATNFSNYQQPFPNFDALQANVRFFAKHGVKNLFIEGNYNGVGGEMAPLRMYLLAKLLWNPDADAKALTADFLRGYYGKAAGAIGEYLELEQRQVRGQDIHAYIFDRPFAPYLSDAFVRDADGILARAEAQAENDDVRLRVQTARLPIWYVQLATNRVEGEARVALLARFAEVAKKAKITMVSESRTLDSWLERMKPLPAAPEAKTE